MRLDLYLFQNGFADSRSQAKALIEAGNVLVEGRCVKKPSEPIREESTPRIEIVAAMPYVSRGGLKLEYALDTFDISVEGMNALDVGASTGGFTDCLLQRGANRVIAVDSGENQMVTRLREDPRVNCIEKYNARYMKAEDFSFSPDIAVMDVSFISQTLILPSLANVLCDGAVFVSLIKPQFEVGKKAVGKKGIVKRAEDRAMAIDRVIAAGAACDLGCFALTRSPITGGDGNVEFLAAFRKGGVVEVNETIIKRIAEG